MTTRIVFMGSPEFALPILKALAEHYPVVGVVTQPDRPAGRGRALTPPPVKQLALELDLPLIQPLRLRQPEAMEQLLAWAPELIVVAAFGQILRPEVLELPLRGCINVHASLLPRWRGAAPIQAALLHSDRETGVTIMMMDPGIDTGPIMAQRSLRIDPDDTAGFLSNRLAQLGADLLIDTLPAYLSGLLHPHHQVEAQATYAPMLKKEDGRLDFTQPTRRLADQVRAFNPWPGAFTMRQGQLLKVHRAQSVESSSPGQGVETVFQDLPAIGCGDGLLVLVEVQPAGKKSMSGKDYLLGMRDWGKGNSG
jgi:methionyl-tRNA formyltransferase